MTTCIFSSPEASSPECSTTVLPTTLPPTTTTATTVQPDTPAELPVTGGDVFFLLMLAWSMILSGAILSRGGRRR